MGILDFVKHAGEKLFGINEAQAAEAPDPDAANRAAGDAIVTYIRSMNLDAANLAVGVDAAAGVATVSGEAADQETKEKIILCAGNVHGISSVTDSMTVATPSDESSWHEVESGDTLWKVSERAYGDGNKYQAIFEANRPMLSHPDKIYPGQKLRVPAATA